MCSPSPSFSFSLSVSQGGGTRAGWRCERVLPRVQQCCVFRLCAGGQSVWQHPAGRRNRQRLFTSIQPDLQLPDRHRKRAIRYRPQRLDTCANIHRHTDTPTESGRTHIRSPSYTPAPPQNQAQHTHADFFTHAPTPHRVRQNIHTHTHYHTLTSWQSQGYLHCKNIRLIMQHVWLHR